MKLLTKLDSYLRGLVAFEVSRLAVDLSGERASLVNTIKVLDTQAKGLSEAACRIADISHFKENEELRRVIREYEENLVQIKSNLERLHPELVK